MYIHSLRTVGLAFILGVSSYAAQAAWQLDNDQSRVSYISIKTGDIAEINHFTQLKGTVDDNGKANLSIDLNSVKTNIDIRDERMRNILFETTNFPAAEFSVQLDAEKLKQLAVGSMITMAVEGEFSLHGVKQKMPTELAVSKLGDKTLQVSSYAPVVVDARNFKLAQGIEKLRELAGLPSISMAVPVSFVLTFK